MNPKLYRIILPVNNIDKAAYFYSNIFNQKGDRVSSGRHYFNLRGIILACYDPKAEGDIEMEWKFHKNQYLYISISNLKIVRDRMKTLECKYLGNIENMPWGETLFYANDPFGNPICFVDEKTVFKGA